MSRLLRSLRLLSSLRSTTTRRFSASPSSSTKRFTSSPSSTSTIPRRLAASQPSAASRSFSASQPSATATATAAENAADHPSEPPLPPPGAADSYKKLWNFVKIPVYAVATAITGSAAYATYAYTTDEIVEKRKALIQTANQLKVREDASSLQKFQNMVYSAAIEVPIKTIELYLDIRKSIEEQVKDYAEPSSDKLLPDLHPLEQHVFTLVLDLNETLVYSDWKRERGWRTFKRPGVDAFLEHLAKIYEIVIYSDQLSVYVEPICDRLDQKGCIRYRLGRNATKYVNGKHYRDLSKLNRDPSRIIYISAHALESSLQPENSVPIKPWKLEDYDTALLDLIPFLEYVGTTRPADIRPVLESFRGYDIASEFIERSKLYQKQLQQKQQAGGRLPWRRTA